MTVMPQLPRCSSTGEWNGWSARKGTPASRITAAFRSDRFPGFLMKPGFPRLISTVWPFPHARPQLTWKPLFAPPGTVFFSNAAKVIPGVIGSRSFIQRGVEHLAAKRSARLRANPVLKKLELDGKPLEIYDHHDCHAHAAYFGSGFHTRGQNALVISYDGSGDGFCCRIYQAENNSLKEIHAITAYHSLGILYSRITQLMGMKPMEHEYKVMGMAPYASQDRAERINDILQKVIRLSDDGLSTVNVSRAWGASMIDKLHRAFRGHRFDWLAAGTQLHFERVMFRFIVNWLKKTNTRNLVLSGGCFMNVKLNMLLAQSEEIDQFFVLPSCGDESLAMGAAYIMNEEQNRGTSKPVEHLYFGNRCSDEEIKAALDQYGSEVGFRQTDDPEAAAAELLAENKIVARCGGHMEWGARALGNRSIMANPKNMTTIHRINKAIKMRDFWMPFAPSVLYEKRGEYIVNPEDYRAPYMIIAFPSTDRAKEEMPAALHPFDQTCRPQVVEQTMNPEYHKIISLFEEHTGIGAIMNTSFNLHGEPIVCSARDALHTLVNSDLDALVLENHIVYRKGRPL